MNRARVKVEHCNRNDQTLRRLAGDRATFVAGLRVGMKKRSAAKARAADDPSPYAAPDASDSGTSEI